MKKVALGKTDLDTCVKAAQSDPIVVTQNGRPLALIVGIKGLDDEQVALGASAAFWRLIVERRQGKTISGAELKNRLRVLDREP
jgi:prevent-host-death family protein